MTTSRFAFPALLACAVLLTATSPVHAQERWTAEPILTIGEFGSDVEFGQVADLAVRPSGEILVLDRMEGAVYEFDAEGRLLGQMGKRGQGPGELSDLTLALMLTADGTVAVADMGNARVSVFGPEGRFRHSFAITPFAGMALSWGAIGSDRLVKLVIPIPSPPGMAELPGMPERFSQGPDVPTLIPVDLEGEELGALATFDTPPMTEFEANGKMRTRMMPETPVWTITPDGLLITGTSASYSFEVRDLVTDEVHLLGRDVGRLPMTRAHGARLTERWEKTFADLDMPSIVRDRMGAPIFPDSLPVVASILPGPRGTLLVRRGQGLVDRAAPEGRVHLDDEERPLRWDILGLDGTYHGTLEFPARFSPKASLGDLVYGVQMDDLDVTTVVVLRVTQVGG